MNNLQLQFLMLIFAGWVNRGQQDVIEYLQEENRVLRERLGGKCLLLTDGPPEFDLGLHANPGSTLQPGPRDRAKHDQADPS
jgi:hypothetical protein